MVRVSFQLMVAIGTAMMVLALWFAFVWWRKRAIPRPRAFLWAVVIGGPAAVVALECGWVVTEVGRYVARKAPGGLNSGYVVGGYLAGIAIMYVTGLLI